jgi:ATP-dependent Lon protease
VGGIKEKVLAARRAGITEVVLPERNRKDVEEDVPEEVRRSMRFTFVTSMDQVLSAVLDGLPQAAADHDSPTA